MKTDYSIVRGIVAAETETLRHGTGWRRGIKGNRTAAEALNSIMERLRFTSQVSLVGQAIAETWHHELRRGAQADRVFPAWFAPGTMFVCFTPRPDERTATASTFLVSKVPA